jgi:hypothetical protein
LTPSRSGIIRSVNTTDNFVQVLSVDGECVDAVLRDKDIVSTVREHDFRDGADGCFIIHQEDPFAISRLRRRLA